MRIYAVASRINGDEFLVCTPKGNVCEPLVYPAQEQITNLLYPYYDVLPRGPEHRDFYPLLERLATFYPVIVVLDARTALDTVRSSMDIGGMFTTSLGVLPFAHVLLKMKAGFIQRHQQLDILKDIGSRQAIGSDGRIRVNVFEVVHSHKGEKRRVEPYSEEALNAILRERGLR